MPRKLSPPTPGWDLGVVHVDANKRTLAIRSWVRILLASEQDDRCIIWPFYRDPKGYARWTGGPCGIRAHRSILYLAEGMWPEDRPTACHRCNGGKLGCVNPRHLYWGSDSDNIRDSVNIGTHRTTRLTPALVREIRAGGRTDAEWAEELGIHRTQVCRVRNRKSWPWID